jgi:hypothetical protein|uniref:Uncharacterized protein n=1 Tax=viral metagenome TaxID=1070528 RepID=A0A6C0D0H9_9ZZZZ
MSSRNHNKNPRQSNVNDRSNFDHQMIESFQMQSQSQSDCANRMPWLQPRSNFDTQMQKMWCAKCGGQYVGPTSPANPPCAIKEKYLQEQRPTKAEIIPYATTFQDPDNIWSYTTRLM